jgi:hypothetical protein
LIWGKLEREYFCGWDWTGGIRLIQFNKSGFSKRRSVRPMSAPTTEVVALIPRAPFSILADTSLMGLPQMGKALHGQGFTWARLYMGKAFASDCITARSPDSAPPATVDSGIRAISKSPSRTA